MEKRVALWILLIIAVLAIGGVIWTYFGNSSGATIQGYEEPTPPESCVTVEERAKCDETLRQITGIE